MLKEFLIKESISFKENVNTNKLITLKTCEIIDLLIDVKNKVELSKVIRFLYQTGTDFKVIGGGSNLLITENCKLTPIIRLTGDFNSFSKTSDKSCSVLAGTSLMNFSRKLIEFELSGLEFGAGIPANFGGAIAMNAGAHGGEICEVVDSIFCINEEGEDCKISIKELNPSYRSMNLPKGFIVYGCDINLTSSDSESIKTKMQEMLAYRKKTQPLHLPSCGSVFKNIKNGNEVRYAGELIESLGLKGKRIGQAEFSNLHANWIVNPKKDATASDVLALINLAKDKASVEYNLTLTPEVQIW